MRENEIDKRNRSVLGLGRWLKRPSGRCNRHNVHSGAVEVRPRRWRCSHVKEVAPLRFSMRIILRRLTAVTDKQDRISVDSWTTINNLNIIMGRRYYCDYCEKTFIDDVEARKKHLSSSLHIKLKKLHYDMQRDLRTLLKEESAKSPCRRFIQSGSCVFTGNCIHTHYLQSELYGVKQQILEFEKEKGSKKQEVPEIPSVDSWLQKYYEKNSKEAEANVNYINTSWTYPEQLSARPDLPPSLLKFEPEDFVDSDFEEWGL